MLRVVVFGGRDYRDSKQLTDALDAIHQTRGIGLIIQGGARGADALARAWGLRNKVPVAEFIANWEFEGRAAGPIRNQAMIDWGKPDLAVGFPGRNGTANMTGKVHEAGIELITVESAMTVEGGNVV